MDIQTAKLESRLVTFRKTKDGALACVGAVYLDTLIDGIELVDSQHILDFEEEIPVEIESRPGGSAYFVAYYLHQLGIASKIISAIGNDENGNSFWDIAARELSPVTLEGTIRTDKGATAITVHLISPSGQTAMYTDRDVLRSLTWQDVNEKLYKTRCNNGIIYIAGIFKTNLHRKLAASLIGLKKDGAIVCLDHGRLHYGQHTNARRRALREALPLVDFYFTTRKELSQFLDLVAQKQHLANKLQDLNTKVDEIVPEIFREVGFYFPPVTIINDDNGQTPMRLVVLRLPGGEVEYTTISVRKIAKTRHSYVGFGDMFQAVFIHNLIHSSTNEFHQLIPESARLAQRCLEWTCAQLGRTIADAVNLFKNAAPKSVLSLAFASDEMEKVNTLELVEKIMRERVSLDELHSICLALSIDFEDLPGEAKGRKIVSLLNHLQKKQSINSLLVWLTRNRPDIDLSTLED